MKLSVTHRLQVSEVNNQLLVVTQINSQVCKYLAKRDGQEYGNILQLVDQLNCL